MNVGFGISTDDHTPAGYRLEYPHQIVPVNKPFRRERLYAFYTRVDRGVITAVFSW